MKLKNNKLSEMGTNEKLVERKRPKKKKKWKKKKKKKEEERITKPKEQKPIA